MVWGEGRLSRGTAFTASKGESELARHSGQGGSQGPRTCKKCEGRGRRARGRGWLYSEDNLWIRVFGCALDGGHGQVSVFKASLQLQCRD